jgi:hypothetical protein
MTSYHSGPSNEEMAKLNLPEVASSSGSALTNLFSDYHETPGGRAGRRAEQESSLSLYRIQRETEKAERIVAGAARINVRGFSVIERSAYAMISTMLSRQRPESVDLYLKQLASQLLGGLGDNVGVVGEAYLQKVIRELR